MIKTEEKYNNEQDTTSYHLDAIAAVNERGEDVFLESLQEMKNTDCTSHKFILAWNYAENRFSAYPFPYNTYLDDEIWKIKNISDLGYVFSFVNMAGLGKAPSMIMLLNKFWEEIGKTSREILEVQASGLFAGVGLLDMHTASSCEVKNTAIVEYLSNTLRSEKMTYKITPDMIPLMIKNRCCGRGASNIQDDNIRIPLFKGQLVNCLTKTAWNMLPKRLFSKEEYEGMIKEVYLRAKTDEERLLYLKNIRKISKVAHRNLIEDKTLTIPTESH